MMAWKMQGNSRRIACRRGLCERRIDHNAALFGIRCLGFGSVGSLGLKILFMNYSHLKH
jgi:hypothetical protein